VKLLDGYNAKNCDCILIAISSVLQEPIGKVIVLSLDELYETLNELLLVLNKYELFGIEE